MRERLGEIGRTVAMTAAVFAALAGGHSTAQIGVPPQVIQIDTFTCAELLAQEGDERDRLLIYINGYLDGRRQQRTWNAEVVGKRIDRALVSCKANPSAGVLDTFAKAWDQ
jgi:hypothetical protein